MSQNSTVKSIAIFTQMLIENFYAFITNFEILETFTVFVIVLVCHSLIESWKIVLGVGFL